MFKIEMLICALKLVSLGRKGIFPAKNEINKHGFE